MRIARGRTPDGNGETAADREAGRPECQRRSIPRGVRPAPEDAPRAVNVAAAERDLAEREAVILDKMTELGQALFNCDLAASHTDPHLRNIAWRQENAMLALGTATSLAQLIFART
jgi:hypothetical protein